MKRIYFVTDNNRQYLIRANNKSQAVRHVADQVIKADVATQEQLVTMISGGMEVIEAGTDKEQQHEHDPL